MSRRCQKVTYVITYAQQPGNLLIQGVLEYPHLSICFCTASRALPISEMQIFLRQNTVLCWHELTPL